MKNLYRHEQKYICSAAQLKHLFEILKNILPEDIHQNGSYHIRSLYFDTSSNRFLEESLNGIAERSKYRLRIYNNETQKVKFECKSSFYHLKQKRFIWLNPQDTEIIAQAKNQKLCATSSLLNQFYVLKKTESIKPAIIIDYDRTAFVCENLNVRITLDQNITASCDVDSFFKNQISNKQILPQGSGILEVKFDEILPTYITEVLGLEDLEQTTFSKYVMGRLTYIQNNQLFDTI